MDCLSFLLTLSLHLGIQHGFNEINPHIRCEVASSSFGMYYNSERNISFYMSQNLKIRESEVEIGLATGYRDANVIPLVRWKKNNWFIAPMYGNTWYYTKYPDHTVWVKGKKDVGVIIGYDFKIGKRK
tara:strand:+ start:50 stop:433 length:384 start_codon:yes stop_codon:yes gene_type:complete